MIKSFKRFFLEEVDKETNAQIVKEKIISLLSQDILVTILKNVDDYFIKIESMKDPNISGSIKYDSFENAILALLNFENDEDLLKYIEYISKEEEDCYNLIKIVSDEVTEQNELKKKEAEEEAVKSQELSATTSEVPPEEGTSETFTSTLGTDETSTEEPPAEEETPTEPPPSN